MEKMKFQTWRFIVGGIIILCALIVGVVFAVLPKGFYVVNGLDYSTFTRFFPLILSGGLALLLIILVLFRAIPMELRLVRTVNTIVDNVGDSALVLKGKIIDREADRENAAKNANSMLLGGISAMFIGIGFFSVNVNDPVRIFVLHDGGIFAVERMKGRMIQIEKNDVQYFTMKTKRNELILTLVPLNITFSLNTRKLSIPRSELIDKLKKVFFRPLTDHSQTADETTTD